MAAVVTAFLVGVVLALVVSMLWVRSWTHHPVKTRHLLNLWWTVANARVGDQEWGSVAEHGCPCCGWTQERGRGDVHERVKEAL